MGLLGSLRRGRKVSAEARGPSSRAAWSGRKALPAGRACPRRLDQAAPDAGRAPPLHPVDDRREGAIASEIPESPGTPTAAAVATARVCQGAELPPRAATEKPRRVQGGGEARRLLLPAAAGSVNPGFGCRSEAAAHPAAPGCGGRTPAPRRRGDEPSHGPRFQRQGQAPVVHSSFGSGKAGGRRRQPHLRRPEVGSFLPAAAGEPSAAPPRLSPSLGRAAPVKTAALVSGAARRDAGPRPGALRSHTAHNQLQGRTRWAHA